MSDIMQGDARTNYALTTETFDMDHYLQISCGGTILATVMHSNTQENMFLVFNGDGLNEDEDDSEMSDDQAVKQIAFTSNRINDAWREIARFGYLHALGKMMIEDARNERDEFSFAA